MAKVNLELWFWMHAFDWPKQTVKFTCNTLRISLLTMTCAELCCKTTWDIFLSLLPSLGLEKGIWEEEQVPNIAKNLGFRCLHLIGWNKQSKLGAVFSIFSLWEWLVQSYSARFIGNIFLNFVSNLSYGEGNWVLCLWHQHISKMGYYKCTILFNICTISFLSCYDIGCTIWSFRYIRIFLKWGYLKCTILFNICTISFLSC